MALDIARAYQQYSVLLYNLIPMALVIWLPDFASTPWRAAPRTARAGGRGSRGRSLSSAPSIRESGSGDRAQKCQEERLTIERQLGNPRGEATALHHLGRLAHGRGQQKRARSLYDESLALSRRSGGQDGLTAATLHQLGRLALDGRRPEKARALFEESLAMRRALEDQQGVASTLHQLGRLSERTEDWAAALAHYRDSLQIKEGLGDRWGVAATLHQLGALEQRRGDHVRARQLLGDSLATRRAIGDRWGVAQTLTTLGLLAQAQDRPAEAIARWRQALAIFERLGAPQTATVRRLLAATVGSMGGRPSGD